MHKERKRKVEDIIDKYEFHDSFTQDDLDLFETYSGVKFEKITKLESPRGRHLHCKCEDWKYNGKLEWQRLIKNLDK